LTVLLTQLLAFIVTIVMVVATTRRLAIHNKPIAILGAAVAGALLSIISDFTVAYGVDGYDRTVKAVVERAVIGGVLAMIVGYFSLRSSPKNLD
jgi:hypothetical protein